MGDDFTLLDATAQAADKGFAGPVKRKKLLYLWKVRRTAPETSGLLLAVGLIVAACAATAPALTPIRDPTQRLDVPGLSILPPQGENWFHASSPRQPEDMPGLLVQFVKKLWDAPPTRPEDARVVVAVVSAHDISGEAPTAFESADRFLDWVRKWGREHSGQMVALRRRMIDFAATRDDFPGATCARYTRLSEQTGWGPFAQSVFNYATRGLLCLHPHWPRYMINVAHTQLYPKGQKPLRLDAEVEPFLKSLLFTAQRPVADAPTPARWAERRKC